MTGHSTSAESDSLGSNGSYSLEFHRQIPFTPLPGEEIRIKTQEDKFGDDVNEVDGAFYDYIEDWRQFEEYACHAEADVYGERTDGSWVTPTAWDMVGEMPDVPWLPPIYPEPQVGISPVDPNATYSPGETHEFRLITDGPYYYVDWYVKAPWDTSERGTYEQYDPGDGTTTETTFSYTFPSGAMHTGDFLITAVFYLWSSDPSEHEETYTVNVQ